MTCELCGENLAPIAEAMLIAEAIFRGNDRGQLRAYCLSCADELAAFSEEEN